MDIDEPDLVGSEAEDLLPPSPYRSVATATLGSISTHTSMTPANVLALRVLLSEPGPPTPEGIASALSEPEPNPGPGPDEEEADDEAP